MGPQPSSFTMDQELLYRRKRKKPRRFKEQVNPKIAGSLRAAEGIAGFKSVVLACFCKQTATQSRF
jgi:hypothetical protein